MASKFLNISTDTTLGGNSPSDAVVSSQKAIKAKIDTKQDTLVSGTNIKTINGTSLLGSGNIDIQGGGTDISNHKVNGAPLSNTSSHFFGVSTSAAADVEKVVSIPSITELTAGVAIIVLPTVTSTVANATLKLNNFTAYPMRYQNSAITTTTDAYTWTANTPSVFVFDGDYWRFVCQGYRQEYSAMSVSEGTTGTKTTARSVRADYLKQIIQGTTLTGLSTSTNSAVVATDSITIGIGKLQAQVNTKQSISNLVTSVSSSSTDSQYPSAKLFYDTCGDIESAINTIRGV